MAEPNLLPGNRFRLYRGDAASPEVFTFVCLATTLSLARSNAYEDVTVPDCDDPTALPDQKSVKRSRSWNLSFAGVADPVRIEGLEDDFNDEGTRNYQLLMDRSAAEGGRTYTGAVHIENLEIGKNDNGLVRFTATARGDGALVTTAVP